MQWNRTELHSKCVAEQRNGLAQIGHGIAKCGSAKAKYGSAKAKYGSAKAKTGQDQKCKGEDGLRTATEGKAQRKRRNGQQWNGVDE